MKTSPTSSVIFLSFFATLVIAAIVVCVGMAYWTQDEFNYVAALLVKHPVHIPLFSAIILNIIGNGVTFLADICISIMRASGII